MKQLVQLGKDSYPICIYLGIFSHAREEILPFLKGKQIFIISDDHVFPLYGERLCKELTPIPCHTLVLPHGEATKDFQSLPKIYQTLVSHQCSRSDLIVALGGGVIGDLVGFAAATYLRGVSFVQIPTSLLAQVDSSVGGKVAVDLPEGKNLVGAFYQPKLVLIYPELLRSLPKRYLVDGMGEVIKYGCIKDATLFEKLESIPSYDALFEHLPELIFRCVEIKRLIVQQDTYDTGERMLLNFGHTLAHAIETKYAYQRESHGEAVAIGMYQLTRYAQEQGLTKQGSAERLAKLLQHYELPLSCEIPLADLLPIMMRDKKNLNNHLHLVLLHQIGDAYLYPTSLDFFTHKERIL